METDMRVVSESVSTQGISSDTEQDKQSEETKPTHELFGDLDEIGRDVLYG
jgi:hypothetical protein